jgi:DNA-binding NarL/FixJ family response regulator
MHEGAAVCIVLIDDHAVVRAGYRRFLEQEPGYEVIAEASSGEAAYALLQTRAPDIVILDLSMPGEGGLSTLRRFKLRWPLLPVLVFSMHDHLAFAIQALRAGANGYITKSSDPQLMVSAVRRVLAGELAVSPDLAVKMARGGSSRATQPTLGLSVRHLPTDRERQESRGDRGAVTSERQDHHQSAFAHPPETCDRLGHRAVSARGGMRRRRGARAPLLALQRAPGRTPV